MDVQEELPESRRQRLKKNWTENAKECVHALAIVPRRSHSFTRAKKSLEEIFDGV
jgi:hypothetical protein